MAMRKGDPQGPTRTGQPLGGRWCGECGGEMLYRRRRGEGLIVSYLVCQFCGAKTPMLNYDLESGAHTDLTPQESGTRECYFCHQVRPLGELEHRCLGEGIRGLALGCKGNCSAVPGAVTLSPRRTCDFCGRLRPTPELMIGARRGTHGFALGCKGGCAPKEAVKR